MKVILNNKEYTTGFKKLEPEDVGQKVLVFNQKEDDPIEGKIHTIDTVSNIIVSVLIEDKNKKEKVLNTKSKIVRFILDVKDVVDDVKPIIENTKSIWRRIKRFFSKIF